MELIEIFLNIIHGYRNVSVDRKKKKKRPVGRTSASKWDKHVNAKVGVLEVELSVGTSRVSSSQADIDLSWGSPG